QKVGTTLSNGNRTATVDNNGNAPSVTYPAGGQGGVRGNIGLATGKGYFEFVVNAWDPSGADGVVIGIVDSAVPGFPGFPVGQGIGFCNNDYYINVTEGGAWTTFGTVIAWVHANVYMSAGPRYGVKVDATAGWADIISVLAPEGTHLPAADG